MAPKPEFNLQKGLDCFLINFRMLQVLLGLALVTVALSASPRERALGMLSKMNLTEKLSMMYGVEGTYVGNIVANDRLGIPSLNMHDGPQGFRTTDETGPDGTTTAWPSALTIAATWDKELLYEWASAMGDEFKQKGANVALLPGIGIARVPTAGRNFEYLCGEDPFLGSHLVQPVVTAIQDKGIIANAKHFVNNEIETDRGRVSSNVEERVRFELYYPPFQAAAEAGVHSVMCSYNRINDVYACQNNDTFTHLREQMGFDGFILSDWCATQSTVDSLNAGLDQELPFGQYYTQEILQDSLKEGSITLEQIDTAVVRILTSMYAVGLFDNAPSGDPLANVTSDVHNALARKFAAMSTVLLKNDNSLLPLSAESLSTSATGCVAVIGDETTNAGGGSGHVVGPYTITPTQGVVNALTSAGVSNVKVLYDDGSDVSSAVKLAASCEVAIVNVATNSCEGSDRENLSLGNNQDELISAVAAANKNTIVSVVTPGAILLPWNKEVPAILISWMPGQEAGNALADVLFGAVNPSARLPVTLPNKENEIGFTAEQFPGVTGSDGMPEAAYTEELLIGYRWYDANDVTPLYPFGHGLSYTSFEYSDLSIKRDHSVQTGKSWTVSATVKNTGAMAGAEVLQLYLSYPSSTGEPPRQLRGINKTPVMEAGASVSVSFTVSPSQMSVWDAVAHKWSVASGTYTVAVGASSRDLRLTGEVTV